MSKRTEWDLFAEALAKKPEKRPAGNGWMSMSDIMANLGLSPSRSSEKMNAAVRAGCFERFDGNVVRDGRLTRAVWFRPVKRKN